MTTTRLAWSRCDGGRVASLVTEPDGPVLGTALLCPGFNQSSRDLLPFAVGLAANGLTAVRVDTLDNLGRSDGDIHGFGIGAAFASIRAVWEDLQPLADGPIILIGSSFGSLPVLRLASEVATSAVVMVAGVVDGRQTLVAASGTDHLGVAFADLPAKVVVDGVAVDPRPIWAGHHELGWCDPAVASGWVSSMAAPVRWYVAPDDPWVEVSDVVRIVAGAAPGSAVVETLGIRHDATANLVAVQTLVADLLGFVAPQRPADAPPVVVPGVRDLIAAVRADRAADGTARSRERDAVGGAS